MRRPWTVYVKIAFISLPTIGGLMALLLTGAFSDKIKTTIINWLETTYTSNFNLNGKLIILTAISLLASFGALFFSAHRYHKKLAILDSTLEKLIGNQLSSDQLDMLIKMSNENGILLFDPYPSERTLDLELLVTWEYAYTPFNPEYKSRTLLTAKGQRAAWALKAAQNQGLRVRDK